MAQGPLMHRGMPTMVAHTAIVYGAAMAHLHI